MKQPFAVGVFRVKSLRTAVRRSHRAHEHLMALRASRHACSVGENETTGTPPLSPLSRVRGFHEDLERYSNLDGRSNINCKLQTESDRPTPPPFTPEAVSQREYGRPAPMVLSTQHRPCKVSIHLETYVANGETACTTGVQRILYRPKRPPSWAYTCRIRLQLGSDPIVYRRGSNI